MQAPSNDFVTALSAEVRCPTCEELCAPVDERRCTGCAARSCVDCARAASDAPWTCAACVQSAALRAASEPAPARGVPALARLTRTSLARVSRHVLMRRADPAALRERVAQGFIVLNTVVAVSLFAACELIARGLRARTRG